MKRFLAALLSILMIFALCACGQTEPPQETNSGSDPQGEQQEQGDYTVATSTDKYNLKFSSSAADGTAWTTGCQKFAELVEQRTNGNVKITVYPSDQLSGGNQSKGLEQVMSGIDDMDAHSNVTYTVYDESYGVISLPFLYSKVEDADAIIAEGGPGYEIYRKMLEKDNLVLLGIAENGMRQLTTNTPVYKPADLKGLKIRIPGINMYLSIFGALGANAQTMNFSELFTALQQKTVDGQENPVDLIDTNKFYEVQDYITMWNYSYDVIFFVVNKDLYDSMPADYQKILKECGQEACAYEIELNRSRTDEQLANFKANGMEVIYPDEQAVAEFRTMCEPVFDTYGEIFGDEIVNAFKVS